MLPLQPEMSRALCLYVDAVYFRVPAAFSSIFHAASPCQPLLFSSCRYHVRVPLPRLSIGLRPLMQRCLRAAVMRSACCPAQTRVRDVQLKVQTRARRRQPRAAMLAARVRAAGGAYGATAADMLQARAGAGRERYATQAPQRRRARRRYVFARRGTRRTHSVTARHARAGAVQRRAAAAP